jgi:hypothetical protein
VIYLDDRFLQQLKKGVLEMLVLDRICQGPTYGYALLIGLKDDSNGFFALKEGTLYPILYRLEDDGLIVSSWSPGEGRAAPKKIYTLACRVYEGQYDAATVKKWLTVFYRRFFSQQFKRNCLPDGVKVGSVSLSPRGDWRMPSDATARIWLAELENL